MSSEAQASRPMQILLAIGVFVSLVVYAPLCSPVPAQANTAANSDVHWPSQFTPKDADLFVHNEILVNASCPRVWSHLAAAPIWPKWYPSSQNVKISEGNNDYLEKGAKFSFDVSGYHFAALIAEFIPGRRLAWFDRGDGIQAFHSWLLLDVPTGCNVVSEVVIKGKRVAALQKVNAAWLGKLKLIAETVEKTKPIVKPANNIHEARRKNILNFDEACEKASKQGEYAIDYYDPLCGYSRNDYAALKERFSGESSDKALKRSSSFYRKYMQGIELLILLGL